MKIVVLDGETLSRDDLTWDQWNALGDVRVYPRTRPEELLARAADAHMVLTNKVVIDAQAMAAMPHLRYIGVLATGYNVVDIEAAASRGITVTNVPAYSTMSVAQMVFAHILNFTNRVAKHTRAVIKKRQWEQCPDFCFTLGSLQELDGKTLGIVGLGNTGMAVARIGQAFGMDVVAYTSKENPVGICKAASLDELFAQSDFLTLHCPLTPQTRHMVDERRLALMKPTAYLVNTARGPLVDEMALAFALKTGRLAGAGIDVLEEEPPRHGSPLIEMGHHVSITPHIAWATREARERLMAVSLSNVSAFLSGSPQNVVN